jgi:asparagine synthase (glutamine-hydrolysing)
VPIAQWLRTELADYARNELLGSQTLLPSVFSVERIRQLLDEHVAGKADRAYPIWTLLCFELWAREFHPVLPS